MDKVKEISKAIIEAFEEQINGDIESIIELISDILKKISLEIGRLGAERKHLAICAFINSGISEFVKSRIDAVIDFSEMVDGFKMDESLLESLLESICKRLDEKLDALGFNTILALCERRQQNDQRQFWERLSIITNKES